MPPSAESDPWLSGDRRRAPRRSGTRSCWPIGWFRCNPLLRRRSRSVEPVRRRSAARTGRPAPRCRSRRSPPADPSPRSGMRSTIVTISTSVPKICSERPEVSFSAGACSSTSMATLGASSSWVVSAGTSSARTVSKNTPEARPAAASASASAGSNSSEPAGISPADALVKGSSATSPSTSSRSRSRIARTSPTPRSVIAYQSASSPAAKPPASAFGLGDRRRARREPGIDPRSRARRLPTGARGSMRPAARTAG